MLNIGSARSATQDIVSNTAAQRQSSLAARLWQRRLQKPERWLTPSRLRTRAEGGQVKREVGLLSTLIPHNPPLWRDRAETNVNIAILRRIFKMAVSGTGYE
jgi:hypothetical protein